MAILVSVENEERFSFYKLLSEYLREASVLILVFGFLDPLVPTKENIDKPISERLSGFTFWWVAGVLGLSLGLFALGSRVEWKRFQRPKP